METSDLPSSKDLLIAKMTDYDKPERSAVSATSEKRMIAPGARDAPRFKSTKPEELRRFIRLMEDLWYEARVTDDKVKKQMIGKYADQESEEEWAAFETFVTPYSWNEFKAELIGNYPEAAAAERGTPERLRKICKETEKINLGDMISLFAFRRSFMAEARKLAKDPPIVGNRELVELFLGCLSEHFASAVLQFLALKPINEGSKKEDKETSKSEEKKKPRRPEDKYDWQDVCKAALEVSENSQGMFSLMKQPESRRVLFNSQPVSESRVLLEKVHELEGDQALEKDRLVSISKTLDSRMGSLENMLKSFLSQSQANGNSGNCKGDCKAGPKTQEPAPSGGPTQKWGSKSLENERCFWCGLLGHFQADCEDMKQQISIGNIKYNAEGKIRLRDGSFIPKHPSEATLKERVAKHYAKKPSQFYYGEYEDSDAYPLPTSAFSQNLNSNEADKRVIAQLKAELELRKREEALDLKQRLLEQNERKAEQASGSTRAANMADLLGQLSDEELAAIRAVKSGFH